MLVVVEKLVLRLDARTGHCIIAFLKKPLKANFLTGALYWRRKQALVFISLQHEQTNTQRQANKV